MFPTIPPPPHRLLVFARLPELGRVKRRLSAEIGDERALAVYEAMLRDVIASVGSSTPESEVEFLWAPTPAASGAALRKAFAQHAVAMQTGTSFGDRLSMAFSERFFFHRTEKIVGIGVDDPTLPSELVAHAFALLDSCEYVIGPAERGGYYLFGCRALSFEPSVFQDIDWHTQTVLPRTMSRIAATGRTVALLPQRFDIVTAADLARFRGIASSGELADLLRQWDEPMKDAMSP